MLCKEPKDTERKANRLSVLSDGHASFKGAELRNLSYLIGIEFYLFLQKSESEVAGC